MPRKRKSSWKTSFSKWTARGGGYAIAVRSVVYEVEPVRHEERHLYRASVATGKHASRVHYIGDEGVETGAPVYFRSPDEARRSVVEHFDRWSRRRSSASLVTVRGKFAGA